MITYTHSEMSKINWIISLFLILIGRYSCIKYVYTYIVCTNSKRLCNFIFKVRHYDPIAVNIVSFLS